MPQRNWLAQFNWAVVGPLVTVLALIIGVAGFVVSLTVSGEPSSGVSPAPEARATSTPQPGTGGGVELLPPQLVRSPLFSLSARVNGSPTIRRGPGTQYAAVRQVADGQEFHVIACSPGCEWLRLLNLNDDGQWWLPAVFLSVSGKLEQLPVLVPTESTRP